MLQVDRYRCVYNAEWVCKCCLCLILLPLPFLVLPSQKERRELEQTNAELHQKLFDMEAELEKLRPFKDQATSVSEHTHVHAHTHTHNTLGLAHALKQHIAH